MFQKQCQIQKDLANICNMGSQSMARWMGKVSITIMDHNPIIIRLDLHSMVLWGRFTNMDEKLTIIVQCRKTLVTWQLMRQTLLRATNLEALIIQLRPQLCQSWTFVAQSRSRTKINNILKASSR